MIKISLVSFLVLILGLLFVGHASYGQEGEHRCDRLIPLEERQKLTQKMDEQDFEQKRQELAEGALKDHNLLSKDLAEILLHFQLEFHKLSFVKVAYGHLCDRENIEVVYESFDSQATILELERFLDQQ